MIKVDLHTHSIASPDGSIDPDQYYDVLEKDTLDCIAITDHNRIDMAQKLQEQHGQDKIIVGEEISTIEGDVIGLFLKSFIEPNLTIETTIDLIHSQGGIVYVPHPFETVRRGISRIDLERVKDQIDLIESANGRAYFQNFGPEAHTWARIRSIPALASSDAHRVQGLGKTYSLFKDIPTAANIVELAQTARKFYERPTLLDVLAPKLNKLGKVLGRK